MEDQRRVSYVRTLTYTIFAGILSIALFAVLFIKGGRDFLVAITILEFGIFVVIFSCIYAIINRERALAKMKDPKNYVIKFDDCPNYYVKRFDNATSQYFCSNEYVVADKRNPTEKLIMKINDASDMSAPDTHSPTFVARNSAGMVQQPPVWDKFMVNDIYKQLDNDQDRCAAITRDGQDKPTDKIQGYRTLPWTSVKERCSSLYGKN